eukprot:2778002-Prymnesium_polylepis.1
MRSASLAVTRNAVHQPGCHTKCASHSTAHAWRVAGGSQRVGAAWRKIDVRRDDAANDAVRRGRRRHSRHSGHMRPGDTANNPFQA